MRPPIARSTTDHSIMGDYVNEGLAEAEAKPRHGDRLAGLIGPNKERS